MMDMKELMIRVRLLEKELKMARADEQAQFENWRRAVAERERVQKDLTKVLRFIQGSLDEAEKYRTQEVK